jgi:hypothetical protein
VSKMFWRVSAASLGVAASLALTSTGAAAATGDDKGDFKVKNCVPDNKAPVPEVPAPKPPEMGQPPEKGKPQGHHKKNPCKMILSGSKFRHGKQVLWMIKPWTAKGDAAPVMTKMLAVNNLGGGNTPQFSIPEGKYTLLWSFVGEHGFKHKHFWVICHKKPPHHPGKPGFPHKPPHGKPPHEAPSPTPTKTAPAAPAAPKPTPTSESKESGLPVTGFPAALAAGLGALLVLGGTAATILVRRRGQHTTGT